MAIELITPLRRLAHREHGFYSFLRSNTISFALLFSINKGISKESQIFCKRLVSKNSNPGWMLIAISSNFLG